MPPLNIYLDNGRSWKRYNVTLDMIKAEKVKKVAVNKDIEKYWLQFLEILEKDKNSLFNPS